MKQLTQKDLRAFHACARHAGGRRRCFSVRRGGKPIPRLEGFSV